MKVIIFTEGGKRIGYGHLTRCIALYEEIQSRGIEVELIIHGDLEDIDLLKDKIYLNDNWINSEYINNTITKENYVILDSYLANKECYAKIALNSKVALFIDDNGRIEYSNGIIVNPAIDATYIDYSYTTNNRIFVGSKYVILRSSFRGIERNKLQNTIHRVLVVLGGTDIRNISSKVIDNICSLNQDIIFDVIINADQYDKIVNDKKLNNINYHKNLSATEMCQIMLESDLAISAAGQTIHELIATQTPFIAIQVADNQQNNIDSLVKHIPSQIVLRYDEENFLDELKGKFLEMINYDTRKKITEEMKGIIDANGSKRIVDILLNDKKMNDGTYLRKAFSKDIEDVFELSNKDYVRRYSINKDKITWDDHVIWFNNVLEDKNIVFYVVTDESNSFLGQIRFKLENDIATASISLLDRIRGKGLSRRILNKSIDKLFAEKSEINKVVAYVSENNIASMKIFKSLNFVEVGKYASMIKFILRRSRYYDN